MPIRRTIRTLRQHIPSGVVVGRQSAGDGPAEFVPLDDIIGAQLDAISDERGSILYRGASRWVALPPGTAGQVLQTQGPSADPVWADPSGGGGSSSELDFAPPLLSTFTQTVTTGVPTITLADNAKGLVFNMSGGASDRARRCAVAPAQPFTITARFRFTPFASNDRIGLMIRENSTNRELGITHNTSGQFFAEQWVVNTLTNFALTNGVLNFVQGTVWLRITLAAGTADFLYSNDGVSFRSIGTRTLATAGITTIDRMCLTIRPNGGAMNSLWPFFAVT